MDPVSLIIVAAGSSTRMRGAAAADCEAAPRKVFLQLGGKPVLAHSFAVLGDLTEIREVVVVSRPEDRERVAELWNVHGPADRTFRWAEGGATRAASVRSGLACVSTGRVVLVHDAARPLASAALFLRVISAARVTGAAVPGVEVVDTLKRRAGPLLQTVSRADLFRVQTPQGFRVELLRRAHAEGDPTATDDAMLVESLPEPVELVPGEVHNGKITHPEDLEAAELHLRRHTKEDPRMLSPELPGAPLTRLGFGADLHRLEAGGPLRLGGVDLPAAVHSVGHSDGDALLHAVTDGLLGAVACGDIGAHFSDQDASHLGRDSRDMLRHARAVVAERGYRPQQVDCVVWLERPRLAPHRDAMRTVLAEDLGLPLDCVSVKAKTHEGLGDVGAGEAIRCEALVVVERVPAGG